MGEFNEVSYPKWFWMKNEWSKYSFKNERKEKISLCQKSVSHNPFKM
jgi:hypothetical protein